jgi:hypothetical protein
MLLRFFTTYILQLTSSTNTGPVMLLVNQPVRYNSMIRAKFSFIKEYRMAQLVPASIMMATSRV